MLTELILDIVSSHQYLSTRDAFGLALEKLGSIDNRLVVIDGDLSQSTRTYLFANSYPERFFNVGIAEQDMVSISAGLASCGKIPIVVTYATFLVGRGLDQIRNMVAYCHFNVKLIGTHVGLATGEDGATHQALEDIGIMRGIPRMRVISPADAVETVSALHYAVTIAGPVYLRISREKGKIIHDKNYRFNPEAIEVLRDFRGKRIALLATGTMVARGFQIVQLLEKAGCSAGLLNVHTLKPIDKDTIFQVAREVDLLVTLEDHNIIGGLGSTVADVLAEHKTKVVLRKIGIEDTFGESGTLEELYKKHHLTVEQIVECILKKMETLNDEPNNNAL